MWTFVLCRLLYNVDICNGWFRMYLYFNFILLIECYPCVIVDAPQLTDPITIDNLQEKSQLALEEYDRSQYPNQPSRSGRILLRLPGLKAISGSFLEQLFFSRLLASKACSFESLLREVFASSSPNGTAFSSWPYSVQPALPPCSWDCMLLENSTFLWLSLKYSVTLAANLTRILS